MYLDRPKSPSFTQSGLATNTFRTAMSLTNKMEGQVKVYVGTDKDENVDKK